MNSFRALKQLLCHFVYVCIALIELAFGKYIRKIIIMVCLSP